MNAQLITKENPPQTGVQSNLSVGEWTYSFYRATLYRNGDFFAIVSPDGSGSLLPEQALILLTALQPTAPTCAPAEPSGQQNTFETMRGEIENYFATVTPE